MVAGESRGISQQEAKLAVLRRGVHCALREVAGGGIVMFLERLLGSTGHASDFDAASPADAIRWRGGRNLSLRSFSGLFFLRLGRLSFYLERLRKRRARAQEKGNKEYHENQGSFRGNNHHGCS